MQVQVEQIRVLKKSKMETNETSSTIRKESCDRFERELVSELTETNCIFSTYGN